MSSHIDKLHESASDKAKRWSFGEDFLDTENIRGIAYGNLFLRKQSHLYLVHGVLVAVLLLACFWLVSANWSTLTGWTGIFDKQEKRVVNYTVITSVTQLPPPPPIAQPAAPPPAQKVAPPKAEAPSNVGKIKKVKKEEAPPEQTLATQKEIKQAIQQGGADGGGSAGVLSGPVFVPCEIMPSFIKQKKPRYPDMARRAGIEGKVTVSVLISENGRPIKAQIVKRAPSDQKIFDESAIECVMHSSYSPGIQNGSPIKVWLTVPIRFTLR